MESNDRFNCHKQKLFAEGWGWGGSVTEECKEVLGSESWRTSGPSHHFPVWFLEMLVVPPTVNSMHGFLQVKTDFSPQDLKTSIC